MNYHGNPPPTFRCGHARAGDNIRLSGGSQYCRTCYRSWENAYRQRTGRNEKERLRYLYKKQGLDFPKAASYAAQPTSPQEQEKAAADRVQQLAYASAEDAEQCWCSVCGKAGPVEHSHLYSQHLYKEHANNPLNWLQSCRRCHDEYENKRPLFAKKWPDVWADIIRRMQQVDPKAYDFYSATTPELYPD